MPTISKYAIMNHPDYGYLRPLKSGDTLIKRNTKARPSPSRIILHGEDIVGTVKWNFDLEHFLMQDINIDPVWNGDIISATPIEDCWIEYYSFHEDVFKNITKTKRVLGPNEIVYMNDTFCSDYPINESCSQKTFKTYEQPTAIYVNYAIQEKIGIKTIEKPIEVCKRTGYNIDGALLKCEKYGWKCYENSTHIIAKAPHQSDQKNPKCLSGERCDIFDKKTMVRESRGYSQINEDEIKRLKIE